MNLFKDKKKDNTNWGQSVTGVVIKENKVLLNPNCIPNINIIA